MIDPKFVTTTYCGHSVNSGLIMFSEISTIRRLVNDYGKLSQLLTGLISNIM